MTKVIRLAKIEGRLAIRSIDGILFGIAMLLGVLLLTTMIAGNNQAGNASYTFLDSSFSALLVVGICATAFMGIPLTIFDCCTNGRCCYHIYHFSCTDHLCLNCFS